MGALQEIESISSRIPHPELNQCLSNASVVSNSSSRVSRMSSLLVEMPVMAGNRKGDVLTMPCGPGSTFGDIHMFLKNKLQNENLAIFVQLRGVLNLDDRDLASKTLREYLCLACPLPVYFDDGKGFQIHVRTLTGKVVPITVRNTSSVADVKASLQEKEGIPLDQQRLIFAGKQLQDGQRMQEHDIRHDSILHLVLRLRGGGAAPFQSLSFVDVSNDEARVDHAWSTSAPDWRIAKRGFAIEGQCMNPPCEAFGESVICNMNFGCFSMHTVVPKCPSCNHMVESENFGFNNCFYRIRGVKEGSNVEISIPWTKVGDCYRTWDEDRAGVVEWEHMEVIVRSLTHAKQVPGPVKRDAPIAEECAICFLSLVQEQDIHMLQCCHSYHSECWEGWRDISRSKGCEVTCPLCRKIIEAL